MGFKSFGDLLSGVGSIWGAYDNHKNRESDRWLANSDYQTQLALINKQNEYNTPANQIKRLQEAGLNPNLMYGSITAGNQSSSGSVAPRSNTGGRGSLGGELLQSIGQVMNSIISRSEQEKAEQQRALEREQDRNDRKEENEKDRQLKRELALERNNLLQSITDSKINNPQSKYGFLNLLINKGSYYKDKVKDNFYKVIYYPYVWLKNKGL